MAKLVVHLGHSNCQGFADMSGLQATYQTTFTSIKTWTGSAFASLDYAVNNNQYPTSTKNNKFGVEFALLKSLQNSWNEDVYYLKYGIGGTKVAADGAETEWSTSSKGEYAYQSMSELNKVINYIWNTLGLHSLDVYVVIHHGENDAIVEADSLAFGTNLTNLVTFIRNNISGTSVNLKIVCLGENNENQTQTYKTNVLNSYPSVVSSFSAGAVVSFATNTYPLGVGSHYDATGYRDFGLAMATYILANT